MIKKFSLSINLVLLFVFVIFGIYFSILPRPVFATVNPSNGDNGLGGGSSGPTSVPSRFTVTPVDGYPTGGGLLSPGPQQVISGASATFSVSPYVNNHIVSVVGSGGGCENGTRSDPDANGNSTYTTGAITANCTVTATFAVNTLMCVPPLTQTVHVACDVNSYGYAAIFGDVTRLQTKDASDCTFSTTVTTSNSSYVSDNCVYSTPAGYINLSGITVAESFGRGSCSSAGAPSGSSSLTVKSNESFCTYFRMTNKSALGKKYRFYAPVPSNSNFSFTHGGGLDYVDVEYGQFADWNFVSNANQNTPNGSYPISTPFIAGCFHGFFGSCESFQGNINTLIKVDSGLTASAVASCDVGVSVPKIVVSWPSVTGASFYEVRRADIPTYVWQFYGTSFVNSMVNSQGVTARYVDNNISYTYSVVPWKDVNTKMSSESIMTTSSTAVDCAPNIVTPITVTLTATPPGPLTAPGATTLKWTTTGNPTSCKASNYWSGDKNVNGGSEDRTGMTAGTSNFIITCKKADTGDATDSVNVVVNPPVQDTCGLILTPQLSQPINPEACAQGTLNQNFPADTNLAWNWSCGSVNSCSAPKYGCTTVNDINYNPSGPNNIYGCANTCANGAPVSTYPTCTITPKCSVSTDSNYNIGPCSGICSAPLTKNVTVECDSNSYGVAATSGSVTRSQTKSAYPGCAYPPAPITVSNSTYVRDNCVPVGFNYALSNSGLISITQGQSGQVIMTAQSVSGTPHPVNFSISNVPPGVSASVAPQNCTPSPTCTSWATINVSPSAVPGPYQITITGLSPNHPSIIDLNVVANPAITFSCVASPSTVLVGGTINWSTGTNGVKGGFPPYTYAWSGTGLPLPPDTRLAQESFSMSYSTVGHKTAQLTVTDSNNISVTCTPPGEVQVNFNPNFKEI